MSYRPYIPPDVKHPGTTPSAKTKRSGTGAARKSSQNPLDHARRLVSLSADWLARIWRRWRATINVSALRDRFGAGAHAWLMGAGALLITVAVVLFTQSKQEPSESAPAADTMALAVPAKASDASASGLPSMSNAERVDPADATINADGSSAAPSNELAWQEVTIRSGETLAAVFSRLGLSARTLYELTQVEQASQRLTRIYPGDRFAFLIPNEGQLDGIEFDLDEANRLRVIRVAEQWQPQTIARQMEFRTRTATGRIDGNLFLAGQQAGLSDALIMKMANIFGWDIDFVLDIRAGDRFAVIYEEVWRDGERLRDGEILAASFINRGQRFEAIRFTDSSGRPDYYAADGRNLRKEFLRSPLDVTRVTSRFTMRRFHPVLKVYRPHRGVDYGAATGTPVRATGDGKVIFASKNSSYGNHVIIQHGEQFKTLYAHLSKFGKGVKRGSRVRQGQVIGYSGSTGLATAPHLHYEFRVNDVHRDPLKIEFPKAAPLPTSEMVNFQRAARPLLQQLSGLDGSQVLADNTVAAP